MAQQTLKHAVYADLLALPAHQVGEIAYGVLYAQARPATRHARAASRLGADLDGPFDRGRGGPGGWWLLDEPELHLGPHVLVPDLAGWRRDRLPALPDAPYLTEAPDWVCEVLSPSTQGLDRGDKRRIYAEYKVEYLWLLDPQDKLLEVFQFTAQGYRLVDTYAGSDAIHAVPFHAIALQLSELWLA
jgi:Uma2 family endonuclease